MNRNIFLAELIGTFMLVFLGAGAGALGIGGLVGVALAHGLALLAMAYAFGSISGTHINPAVTLGLLVVGQVNLARAVIYWAAQIIGGVLAAFLLMISLGGTESGLGATILAPKVTPGQGVLVEAVLTFFLLTTIFHAAVSGGGKELAGVAIGMTLAACILAGGPLTGASLNPARTLGPALFTGGMGQVWIYFVGPFLGATVAALAYRVMEPAGVKLSK